MLYFKIYNIFLENYLDAWAHYFHNLDLIKVE